MQDDIYQGDGLNLYAYCKNNLALYYNPSGYACEGLDEFSGDGGQDYVRLGPYAYLKDSPTVGGNRITQNEFDNLIFKIRCESVSKFEEGDYDEGWKLCMKAGDMLPEPKYKQPESRFVVTNIIKYSIETKNFEYADKFLGLLFICGLERADSEDREFWAGRLAYAKGDMDIAKEPFARPLEKGNGYGYINNPKNRIYKELAQGKHKTAKPKSNLPADKLIDKADKLWEKGKNEEAEELYL